MRSSRVFLSVGLLLAAALWLILPQDMLAQGWGSVEGRVTEAGAGGALPGITIVVDGTNFGTATDEAGQYRMRIPVGRYALRFTAIGFEARVDSVVVQRDVVTTLNVTLRPATLELDEVMGEEAAVAPDAGVQRIEPEQVRNMPSPFKGFQALKVLPGVSSNNELSNQYSVRGGGFNENLIFINGFEVYMPFRPRQGEQEDPRLPCASHVVTPRGSCSRPRAGRLRGRAGRGRTAPARRRGAPARSSRRS